MPQSKTQVKGWNYASKDAYSNLILLFSILLLPQYVALRLASFGRANAFIVGVLSDRIPICPSGHAITVTCDGYSFVRFCLTEGFI